MASTCAICQQAAHITYQHLLVLAAQQEPCKKKSRLICLNEKCLRIIFLSQENGQLAENDKQKED